MTIAATTAIELLVKRIWYRSRARIRGIRPGGAPPTCTTHPSPAMRLPQEIVEIVIAYLIYDLPSLRSCSLTCYSWYIAAVSHLHHTLTVFIHRRYREKSRWRDAIKRKHMLGLLPLVKTLGIKHCFQQDFYPKRLNCCLLPKFLTLTNVQTLEIDGLDITKFIPKIAKYFGPLFSTVRSLHLKSPTGSNREIIFFIGSFRYLNDLLLCYRGYDWRKDPKEDPTLIPPFTPPLQGQLMVWKMVDEHLFRDMVHFFGEIRFSALNLRNAGETRFLLRACAKTLRVLRLYPDHPLGEHLQLTRVQFRANDFIVDSSFLKFDLSWNKCLQTLEVPVSSVDRMLSDDSLDASRLLNDVLATIRSPTFSQVKLLYQSGDLHRSKTLSSHVPGIHDASWQHKRFELLHKGHNVCAFQLVLLVDVWEWLEEGMVQLLKLVVATEKARGGFDDQFPEPPVTLFPRSFLWCEHPW